MVFAGLFFKICKSKWRKDNDNCVLQMMRLVDNSDGGANAEDNSGNVNNMWDKKW